jgi:uncharacterized protein
MPDHDKRDFFVALDQVRGKPRSGALPKINVCGDIGLKIARDGTWSYQGSPIRRKPLVKLFASVLRQEDDGSYWLVTPAEKVPIAVERTPFVAVEMWTEGNGKAQRLLFRTNVDDVVAAGAEHRLGFEGTPDSDFLPYIVVRDGLKARLARPVYYELASMAVEISGERKPGVWSGGTFFLFPEHET